MREVGPQQQLSRFGHLRQGAKRGSHPLESLQEELADLHVPVAELQTGDGVVLNSLHARNQTRLYANVDYSAEMGNALLFTEPSAYASRTTMRSSRTE